LHSWTRHLTAMCCSQVRGQAQVLIDCLMKV
jgi:hypothetical protein